MFVSKCKRQRERTGSFSIFRNCVSSGFGSSLGTISPLESKLAMLQCKEDKKSLRAKVKLTVLFRNKASNLETQGDPFNQNTNRSDRENWSTSKGGPVFSKLFWLDRTDPLSFGPKFPEILVEWIAPTETHKTNRNPPITNHERRPFVS